MSRLRSARALPRALPYLIGLLPLGLPGWAFLTPRPAQRAESSAAAYAALRVKGRVPRCRVAHLLKGLKFNLREVERGLEMA